jgi:integrase
LLNATKSIGYGGKVSPHGFRATFSTWANDNAISSPDIIESALAHSVGDTVSRAYNKAEYAVQRRLLLQRWADHVTSDVPNFSLLFNNDGSGRLSKQFASEN